MTSAWIATAILAGAMAAFVWGRLRPEVTAMAVVLALGLTGVVSPSDAFAGFGDPTVITIACLFVLSAGLERTGVAGMLAASLLRVVGPGEAALTVTLMVLAGLLSGVMNIIGALAMLLPVALAVCRETGISPSRLLMPLAIACRLGGALTLVGKPANLVVNGLLVQAGYGPLGFFSFLPVGLALLVVGTAFMAAAGRRLLPAGTADGSVPLGTPRRSLRETYRLPERLFKVRVHGDSMLAGHAISATPLSSSFGMLVLTVIRGRERISAPGPDERLEPGDVLLVEARPEEMERLCGLGAVEVEPEGVEAGEPLETEEIGMAEVVVAPRSDMVGKSLRGLEFRQRHGLTVVAIWRQGRPHRSWLADMPLEYGDALLVRGPRHRIRFLRQDPNFVSLDEPMALRASRAPVAALAVAALIGLGATGLVPLSLAALLAAGLVILGGCATPEEAFRSVDWPTVIVVGGLLPLGVALQTTGAAAWLAGAVVRLAGDAPAAVLAAVLLAAIAVGHFVPGVPGTIMMAPIALGAATSVGASPVPFLIAVASATSATLITPFSHPASIMVMGPGGYRFGDYSRVGAPMTLLLGLVLLGVVTAVWRL